MNSTLDDKLADGQIASLEEQLSNLAREAGVSPSARPTRIPPTSMKTSRAPLAAIHRLADWRYVAFVGSLLAASIGVAASWWSSSVDPAIMAPADPARLTHAAQDVAASKDVAPTVVALHSELAQQLQPIAHDIAALSQTVEQLKVRQEQLVRDNENLASQLKASRDESARNNSIIDQIKADQIEMARESQMLTERLSASQEQLAQVVANASEPKAMLEAAPKVSPEEPKVMPEIPLPRPRQPANVAQTQKPAPTAERSQAKKPQPLLAWPWSVR
jgi:outer membrane murein-binding lipoprotein Lpp